LTKAEKEGLVQFILQMADLGHGYTRDMVKDAVMYLIRGRDHAFGESGPSNQWLSELYDEFPQLALRKPEALSKQRATAMTPQVVNDYFDLLEKLFDQHQFRDKNIYNADETSLITSGGKLKILGRKGQKNITQRVSATLMVCSAADGHLMPPLFIFPGVYHMQGLLTDAPEGSFSAIQENGWMTPDIFFFLA